MVALLLAYTVLYLLLGALARNATFMSTEQVFFWPGLGLASGVMAMCDRRMLRAVAVTTLIASWILSFAFGAGVWISIGSAIVDVATPLLFAWAVGRLGANLHRLSNHRSLLAYALAAVVAGLGGGLVSAVVSVGTGRPIAEFGLTLWRTLAADTVGIVLLAGAAAVGSRRMLEKDVRVPSTGWQTRALPVGVTVVVSYAVFSIPVFEEFSAVGFIVLPLLAWTATVTGQRTVSVVSMAVGLGAILLTAAGSGPFVTGSASTSVLSVQAFVLVTHLTAMALAIESESRRVAVAEFEGILNSTSDAVLVVDGSGVIMSANEGAGSLLAAPVESLAGTPFADHFLGRVPRRGGAEVHTPGGGSRSVEVVSRDVQRGNEWLRTYVLRDLTQARATQDALTRAFEVIDAAPELVAWFDAEGVMQFMNDAGRSLLEIGDSDAFGLTHASLAPTGSHMIDTGVARAIEVGSWNGEVEIARGDGSAVPVDLTVLAHRGLDGALSHTSILARDLTERLELDRLKDEFVSNITHELRTPLTAITGYVELFAEGAFGELDDDAGDAIDAMSDMSARLLELVDDLLTLWRSEQKTSDEWRRFDVSEAVESIVETLRNQAARKGVTLTFKGGPIEAMGNVHHVERAIMNLVSNAVKFTGAGGTVTVVSERSEGKARISVADTGIGIAAEEQEAVFERFFRADSATSAAIPGTGLGLPIVREIALAHGGDVKLQSVLGHGTFVLFEIPVAPDRDVDGLPDKPAIARGDDTFAAVAG